MGDAIQSVNFRMEVGKELVDVSAHKSSRHWILIPRLWPGTQVADLDLERGKRILAKRLLPQMGRRA